MQIKKESYLRRVKDLEYASVLLSSGLNIEDIEWHGNEAVWIFEDKKNKSVKLIRDYCNGKLRGNLKEFKEAEKSLKQMLFSEK